jgi:hypothetical protein
MALPERKSLQIHINERDRKILLRILDANTGKVEGEIFLTAEEAANHTRGMHQVCEKIKATGTHLVLPGDAAFKVN